ncbi:hypothetical protein [Pseudosulfitobacter pseudonitzschiae]|uniref:hypothetical protein n=1 Tax=Pseudosulfitobacter pseudonitzschiae TaxID=1402135 RepID=UPI003B79DE36
MAIVRLFILRVLVSAPAICAGCISSADSHVAKSQAQIEIQDLFEKTQQRNNPLGRTTGEFDTLLEGLKTRKQVPVNQDDIEQVINREPEEDMPDDTLSETAPPDNYIYRGTIHNQDEGGSRDIAVTSDLDEWKLIRTSQGLPVVISRNDRTTAVEVVEGMVLGHLGRIRQIREINGQLELVFTNGGRLIEG